MKLKTYIVESQTNYGALIHIVNAYSEDEAIKLASSYRNKKKGEFGAWPGCTAVEIDTTTVGVVRVSS